MKNKIERFRWGVDKLRVIALSQLEESAVSLGLNLKKDLSYKTAVNTIEWYCKITKDRACKEYSFAILRRLVWALRKIAASLPPIVLEDYYST
jgi:hypothetical protein